MLPTDADLTAYKEQGCIILRQAFSPERMEALLQAIHHLMDRALAGQVELGWVDRDKRVPARTSHLLAPDKYEEAFGVWLHEDLADQIEAMLGGRSARHSLFGMLASGAEPYRQQWHRDLVKPGSPDEEVLLRRFQGCFVQFNAPLLVGDRFLQIVPGSHCRASTPEEIGVAAKQQGEGMPGAMQVELEPGDIVYYNANLWHRGWNPQGIMRWTMHCAFWGAEYAVMKHDYGQHEALLTPGHMERMPARARTFIQRYLDCYPEGDPKSLLEL
jgi:hypothetical protein